MRVVIVGAGPGGALLSYLLARKGADVTLIEQHAELGQEFRGERLLPGALALLEKLGLGNDIAELPQMAMGDQAVYYNKRKLFAAPVGAKGRPPVFIPQKFFLEMLINKASAFSNFKYSPGTRLLGLNKEGNRVVGVEVKSQKAETIPCDLVIGADGRTSAVRKLADLDDESDRPREAFDLVWTQVPAPAAYSGTSTVHMFLDPEGSTFIMPTPTQQVQVGSIIQKSTFGKLRKQEPDAWFKRLMRPLPDEIVKDIGKHVSEVRPSLLNVVCYTLPRWTKPGVLLIGDAAHPMSPAGAQGIFMALRDAIVTSARLLPVTNQAPDPLEIDTRCKAIEDERKPEVMEMQEVQRSLAKAYLTPTKSSIFRIRYVMPVIAKLAPEQFAKMMFAKDKLINGGATMPTHSA